MRGRHFPLAAMLAQLPGRATAKWPDGTFDAPALEQGDLSVAVFAPRRVDRQTPHDQDELYVVVSGRGTLEVDGEAIAFEPGDLMHVPAGVPHRFIEPADDLVTWVVFYTASGEKVVTGNAEPSSSEIHRDPSECA